MADPPEGSVPIKPTMGLGQDEYKLLLNVTSRGGKLVRRPSIKAKFMGYGYPGRLDSGSEAFQYNALYNTGTTSGVYTAQTPTFTFHFTIGAGGGSDATVPANGSSLTLYINPGGVKMEIKISFAASGTSNTAFQVDGAGTYKVVQNIYANDSNTNDCNEIATYIRNALNSLVSTPVNGVDLSGWTVSAVGGSAGARTFTVQADDAVVASNYAVEHVESGDSNNTLLIQNTVTTVGKAQYKGRWWTMPQYQPKDHTQDQTDTTPSFQYEDVAEGIDVEIVNGKLVCLYATRKRLISAGSDSTDIRMKLSVHSIADPLIGHLGLAQKESDNVKVASAKNGGAQSYMALQYWNKRIQRVSEGFVLMGHGVGARVWSTGSGFATFTENLVTFTDAGIKTTTASSIPDDEGLLWYQGFQLPFYRLGDPVTTVERLVEDNVIYAKRRPHNAFMFLNEQGYPIWYGFRRADRQEVNATLPSANAILDGVPVQLRAGDQYILDPGMVWYAEHMNPTSLPAQGYMTAVAAARNNQVVALCRTLQGTACFTRDTVELLSGNYQAPEAKLIHTGVGCDSRWSVQSLGHGVAFVNKDGLHFLGPDPATGQGSWSSVTRVRAFDELFGEGVEFERTPYSDLVVGDSATETVANHPNSLGGSGLAASRYSQELNKVYNHTKHDDADDSGGTSMPFGKYKIDKTRLDRAVSGVWEDLYLFACSRDIDDGGDDNRLILVWNYKENTSTVWLMPKHMGWRGFAYDGGISVPYVMTRYGLAQLNNNKDHDEPFYRVGNDNDNDWRVDIGSYKVFVNQTSSVTPRAPSDRETGDSDTGYDQQALPVLIAGQTRFLSGGNQAFVVPRVMITHDKHRYGWTRKSAGLLSSLDQDDWSNYKKDDDTDMRVQIWGNQTDLEAGTMNEQYAVSSYSSTETDYDLKSFVMSDIGMLDSLYKGAGEKEFRGIRVHPEDIDGGSKTVDHTHGHLRYGSSSTFNDADQTPVRRLRGAVRRTSVARSHVAATKQQVQFYTMDPGTIYSVIVDVDTLAPPGGRG